MSLSGAKLVLERWINKSLGAAFGIKAAYNLIISISIFLVILSFIVQVLNNTSKISFYLKELLSDKTSILTKQELEICNEWVIVLEHADNYTEIDSVWSRIKSEFMESKQFRKSRAKTWTNDIHIVRDLNELNRWMIVIDAFTGVSSKLLVEKEIRLINSSIIDNRVLENTLGVWMYSAKSINYDTRVFAETHGKILNEGDCANKPAVNQNARANGSRELSGGEKGAQSDWMSRLRALLDALL